MANVDASNDKIALYGYWRSGSSWRLRIVLNLKGLDYDYIPVNLLQGKQKEADIVAMNPMMQVPILKIDGHTMTESMAICEYIEEVYGGDGVRLLPTGADDASAFKRLQIRRLCEVINSGTQPIQNVGVLARVAEFGGDKKDWAVKTIEKGLGTFEKLIQETAGKYCVGDEVTLADTFLVP